MGNSALDESYAYCRIVARKRAKNFYYSFLLLSPTQRDAMCAVYSFMRFCDDLSDEAGATLTGIERWREELGAALNGNYGANPLWPAFHDTVKRFGIPHKYFYEMIDGVSSDLQPRTIKTFTALYDYCYHVASVVGLTIIHIFGFEDPQALELAEKCGIAFQLTNIIRDVKEDSENGRTYLPQEDLDRFGADFKALMRFECDRARGYYEDSKPLVGLIHQRSRASLWALMEIYRRLLTRIERSNYDVLNQRISVPTWEKLAILARAAGR